MRRAIVSRIRDGGTAILHLQDICAGFAGQPSLFSKLTIHVAGGELRLVQGPSGCGKSTLLGIISGALPPGLDWSGQLALNGVDIGGCAPEDRRVGLMFQDALLFPHMTVGDNLAFGLASRHRRDRHERINAALAVAGLAGFADRDPATLSGGQAARVALMRTMLAEPEALLMDEAFAALDPDRRREFGGFVRDQIRDRGIPALLVSHDAGDAAFADGDPVRLG